MILRELENPEVKRWLNELQGKEAARVGLFAPYAGSPGGAYSHQLLDLPWSLQFFLEELAAMPDRPGLQLWRQRRRHGTDQAHLDELKAKLKTKRDQRGASEHGDQLPP